MFVWVPRGFGFALNTTDASPGLPVGWKRTEGYWQHPEVPWQDRQEEGVLCLSFSLPRSWGGVVCIRSSRPFAPTLEEARTGRNRVSKDHHPAPLSRDRAGPRALVPALELGAGRGARGKVSGGEKAPTCAGPRLGPRLASEAGGGAPQQAAGREESGAVFGDVGRVGGDGVVGGRRRPSQGGHAAAGVRRLELHAVGQRHLVLDAFLLVLAARAGRARGGQGRVRGDVLRRGGREGEEVRAGVTRRQGGGRGRGVDRQGPRGAVVDGRLGERAEVPGRGGVVAAQGFAAVQPGQGSVQERGTAHLTPCAGQRKGQERDRR